MSILQFQTRQFLLPKSGHQLSECEDAIGINTEQFRFAVADGATEAFDAQTWAQSLAHHWVRLEQAALTTEDFRVWAREQGKRLHDSWNNLSLSWYAEEKAKMGSFAAFVGVRLNLEAAAPEWQAIALGDSCLIHLRNDAVLTSLPVSDYQSFNSAPLLVPSHKDMQESALKRAVAGRGAIEKGDAVLLLSDAAAAWYLKLAEQADQTLSLFAQLLRAERETKLARLFESERVAGRIKDDDIAVIRIEF